MTAAHATHRARLVILPARGLHLRRARRGQVLPVMIVNPALECVQLRQARGRWRPQLDDDFAAAGMTVPGPGLSAGPPVPGASAVLTATDAAVMLASRPGISYESGLGGHDDHARLGRRAITSQGGIMLAVSPCRRPAATASLSRRADSRASFLVTGRPRWLLSADGLAGRGWPRGARLRTCRRTGRSRSDG